MNVRIVKRNIDRYYLSYKGIHITCNNMGCSFLCIDQHRGKKYGVSTLTLSEAKNRIDVSLYHTNQLKQTN